MWEDVNQIIIDNIVDAVNRYAKLVSVNCVINIFNPRIIKKLIVNNIVFFLLNSCFIVSFFLMFIYI
jgi:hypothetical protein